MLYYLENLNGVLEQKYSSLIKGVSLVLWINPGDPHEDDSICSEEPLFTLNSTHLFAALKDFRYQPIPFHQSM